MKKGKSTQEKIVKKSSRGPKKEDESEASLNPTSKKFMSAAWEGSNEFSEQMGLNRKSDMSRASPEKSNGFADIQEGEMSRSRVSKQGPAIVNGDFSGSIHSQKVRDIREQATKKRRRVMFAIIAVVKFWRILEHIKQYGTSSNLYNIAFRSRKSVKKSIFPIAKHSSAVKVKTSLFCLFHPNSTILSIWNLLLFVFVIYALSIMPYLTVFIQTENVWQDAFEDFMDICFILDVLINFFTAIYNSKGE